MTAPRFIVDNNTGKLARWLRMMGYDTYLFKGKDDGEIMDIALAEGRTVLTRDRQIMKRRLVVKNRVRAVLILDEDPRAQLRQVTRELGLTIPHKPFSLCLECNETLVPRERDAVKDLVPPYVYQTQAQYMQCPRCGRVYWRGTHWDNMSRKLVEMEKSVT